MKYESVIGLEIHCELSTKTKIFCGCSTSFGADENTQCCPVCTGMPGALPVLNKKVVEYGIKAGLALNCAITPYGKNDRKNYFYPDLPKAYQISQFDLPLCHDGYLDIQVKGEKRRIGITRIHIEEDAGKLTHDVGVYTGCDFNRCGVPLIEIVSEPDMRSSEEAYAFLESVRNILKYIGVSDCKMQEGSLRCDVNVSLRPAGQKEYGTRAEMKNVNSFRGAARGIDYEIKRQTEILDNGGIVEQETRKWDDVKGVSQTLRSKEEAHDYRYFPEPDLVPIEVSGEWVERLRGELPELPLQKKERFIREYQLPEYDAGLLSEVEGLADYFEQCMALGANAKTVSNWLMGDIAKTINEQNKEMDEIPFPAQHLVQLLELIEKGTISGTIAKQVLEFMFTQQKSPEEIVKEHNLVQVNDEDAIRGVIRAVFEKNPKSIEDYKAGKDRAAGFLVGQTMRELRGKGNPQLVNQLVAQMLSELS